MLPLDQKDVKIGQDNGISIKNKRNCWTLTVKMNLILFIFTFDLLYGDIVDADDDDEDKMDLNADCRLQHFHYLDR